MLTPFVTQFRRETAEANLRSAARSNEVEALKHAIYHCKPTRHIACECLELAVEYSNIDVIHALDEEYEFTQDEFLHPLRLAAQTGQDGAMRALLKRGADPFIVTSNTLSEAVVHDHLPVIHTLLEHAKSTSCSFFATRKALESALSHHRTNGVALLLQAFPKLKQHAGRLAPISADAGDVQTLQLLYELEAEPFIDKANCAHSATKGGKLEVLKFLQQQGYDLSTNDALFDLALNYSQLDVAHFLLCGGYANYEESLQGKREIIDTATPISKITAARLYGAIALEIATKTNNKRDCRRWFDEIGIRYPSRALKSDAFQKDPKEAFSPLTLCLLEAGFVATMLSGRGNKPEQLQTQDQIFTELASNDIARIESTTGLSYRKYHRELRDRTTQVLDFYDVIDEVTTSLTLPHFVLEHRELHPDNPEEAEVYDRAFLKALQKVIPGKSTLDLFALNTKWHRPGNRLPPELTPYHSLGSWEALFEPCQVDTDTEVVCLTDPQELRAEGELLEHCVGGYVAACKSGDAQIISVRREGVPIATIELGFQPDDPQPLVCPGGETLSLKQFKGRNNSPPPAEARRAWERVETLLREGRLPLAPRLGTTTDSRVEDPFEQLVGYPLSDTAYYQKRALEHYQSRMSIERRGQRIPLIGPPNKIS